MGKEHDIVVMGIWQHDRTAGLGLYCRTCKKWFYEAPNDEARLSDLSEAVKQHEAAPTPDAPQEKK